MIAMVMVIVTSGSGGVDAQAGAAEGDGGVKLDGTADETFLRGERPSTVRSTEADAMPKSQRLLCMAPGVKHEESGRCREAPTAVSVAGAD